MLNRMMVAGTDGACFLLFHPNDLAHRKNAECAWWMDDCAKEFAAGIMIAVLTDGDGGFSVRITDGELTELEKERQIRSLDFRYVARHQRVFLDGGDNVPNEQQLHD